MQAGKVTMWLSIWTEIDNYYSFQQVRGRNWKLNKWRDIPLKFAEVQLKCANRKTVAGGSILKIIKFSGNGLLCMCFIGGVLKKFFLWKDLAFSSSIDFLSLIRGKEKLRKVVRLSFGNILIRYWCWRSFYFYSPYNFVFLYNLWLFWSRASFGTDRWNSIRVRWLEI